MTAFARALAQRYGEHRTRIVIPQWADILAPDSLGEPAVYARILTTRDRDDLDETGIADLSDYAAEIVLRMAEDEDGNRLFDRGDKMTLIGAVEADVLILIADSITASLASELEDIEVEPA